jgi:hypothetical protein
MITKGIEMPKINPRFPFEKFCLFDSVLTLSTSIVLREPKVSWKLVFVTEPLFTLILVIKEPLVTDMKIEDE